MQLILAPESNKHEKTKPPVSILNVVPLSVPLLMVNTWEESLPKFKYSLGLYLAGSQSVSFPEILGVDSPTTCVKAASYNCSGILKKLQKLSHSITLMVLALASPDHFACSNFSLSNLVTALKIPS